MKLTRRKLLSSLVGLAVVTPILARFAPAAVVEESTFRVGDLVIFKRDQYNPNALVGKVVEIYDSITKLRDDRKITYPGSYESRSGKALFCHTLGYECVNMIGVEDDYTLLFRVIFINAEQNLRLG